MSTFRIWYKEDRGLGASLVHCMVDENFASLRINRGEHDHELCRLRAGWPVAAMEMSITQGALALAPAFSDAVLAPDWVQRPDRSTRVGAKPRSLMWERYLPLRPVALGLALDTLLYSAVAFAAFSTAGGVRRFARAKTGRCAGCGYDRRGLVGAADAKCPECGTVPNVRFGRE